MKNPYRYKGANLTVDCVIVREDESGQQELLLIQRGTSGVEAGKWALPGGFIETDATPGNFWVGGKETPEMAARRELAEETSFSLPKKFPLTFIGTYEGKGRDPRDNETSWSKSYAYLAKIPKAQDAQVVTGRDDAQNAAWYPIRNLPKGLAFDHSKIIKDAQELLEQQSMEL